MLMQYHITFSDKILAHSLNKVNSIYNFCINHRTKNMAGSVGTCHIVIVIVSDDDQGLTSKRLPGMAMMLPSLSYA